MDKSLLDGYIVITNPEQPEWFWIFTPYGFCGTVLHDKEKNKFLGSLNESTFRALPSNFGTVETDDLQTAVNEVLYAHFTVYNIYLDRIREMNVPQFEHLKEPVEIKV